MALNPSTPGVYVQEISTLPPSVAPVATAIPAFIGYTEKGPLNTPVRITSMIEYQQSFGGAFQESFSVAVTGTYPAYTAFTISPALTALSPYVLFYAMQMYFANGGGPCYIISVANYTTVSPTISATTLNLGVDAAEQVDEITLLLAPDAINISTAANRGVVNDHMLAQCNALQDRFTIMDVFQKTTDTIYNDANDPSYGFRTTAVGANFLKYGAAYYPKLNTTLVVNYTDSNVSFATGWVSSPFTTTNNSPNGTIASLKTGVFAYGVYDFTAGTGVAAADSFSVASVAFIATTGTPPPDATHFTVGNGHSDSATNLVALINAHPTVSLVVRAEVINTSMVRVVALTPGTPGNTIGFAMTVGGGSGVTKYPTTGTVLDTVVSNAINTQLYSDIIKQLNTYTLSLYPGSTMAGIYAAVDNDRGVWKAPANVSLNLVASLGRNITDDDQANLNVDPVGGKSINAIRVFNGRGILVWGARTLDGNSNEWRYVNVRRLFIMAEESCRKASEFVVFEPNDKNTWLRIKGTIDNFLTNLWRDGALAGDKPDQAFFVKVGLNETMTAQDILEGRVIIQIGLAAVRPAEFIILQFMHKLQES